MTARVLIVEDDGFTRMLLRNTVTNLGFDVVGDTASAADGLALARATHPDVALLDLDLGRGPTGIDLAYALCRDAPRIGIVLLTSYADIRLAGEHRGLPPRAIALVKRMVEDESALGAALRIARDPVAANDLFARLPAAPAPALSEGQAEILRLVANGFSNAEIARRRHLSESAVIKALARLVGQLGLTVGPDDNQRVRLAQAYFVLAGTSDVQRG